MKKCGKCQEEKDILLFSFDKRSKDGRTSWCRKCKNDDLKYKVSLLSEDEKRLKYKKESDRLKSRLESFSVSEEVRMKMWARSRKYSSNDPSRKNLDIDFLIKIGSYSNKFFDYLIFYNTKSSKNPLVSASLDRKNNEIKYEEENCIVVPNWLNLAKGTGTYSEIYDYICQFLKNENLFNL